MSAVWIALPGVFAALIPVFVLAAKRSRQTGASLATGADDGGSDQGLSA
ncbi:MAG: hypothetical protein QM698_15165 [Micropepsaceae bacterium]